MPLRAIRIIFRELIGRFPENFRAMDRRKRVVFLAFLAVGLAFGLVMVWFLEHPSRTFGFGLIGVVALWGVYNMIVTPLLVHRDYSRQKERQ